MTLIVDAGALYAQADADDPEHERVAALLRDERGPLVTSQLAAAEADYLILTRLGVDAELARLAAADALRCAQTSRCHKKHKKHKGRKGHKRAGR